MIFHPTPLSGAYVVELEPHADARGFFARSFCMEEFDQLGLNTAIAQQNIAYNHRAGTVRGMHYRIPHGGESKVVRCTRGAIYDVIVDLRGGPDAAPRPFGVELDEENRLALYVPEGFAHGYQSLTDDCEVTYLMGAPYAPGHERGVRYDDPDLGIAWPLDVTVVSEKDLRWPHLRERRDPSAG
ncbi:MAG: dTDP-4-dehydrorhamnose 3,5-epimerase family protein [Deinococcales bacterium]